MNQTVLIAIVAAVAFLVLAKLLLWRLLKRQFAHQAQPPAAPQAAIAPASHTDVVESAATAVEDIAGPLLGIDAHADLSGPPDDLTLLKGLGPKAAAQLKLLGLTRFAQLAVLDGAQIQALDEQMGVFRGRLERDRWVEQARYLARGDTKGFEAEFGRIG